MPKFEDNRKNAQARLDSLKQKLAECETNKSSDDLRYIYSEMEYMFSYLMSEVNYLYDELYRHKQGHLPAIKGAGKMEEILKTLGMDDDYTVARPTITSASTNGVIKVNISSPAKNE